jgi:hypothetical protein
VITFIKKNIRKRKVGQKKIEEKYRMERERERERELNK